MCARSSDRLGGLLANASRSAVLHQARGFTLTELIAVLIITSVLAVVALPRLGGALAGRADADRDALIAALRHGQAVATSHRRLVCAQVSTNLLSLSLAASRGGSCSATLPGVDGQTGTPASGGSSFSLSPAGTLYLQPDGRITRDAAGTTTTRWTLAVSSSSGVSPAAILVVGETGHLE
ncbi:MAG: hypothetical protein RL722_739 [Pseudomonadota bacterium]